MISTAASVCPQCGGPVERPAGERVKDFGLVLFIIAVVVVSGWVIVDQTIGRAAAAKMVATFFHLRMDLNDETVSVPTDEFRGVLVSVPYAGQVTIEVAARGEQKVDVHLINGADLLRLANTKPPFAGLKLGDIAGFDAKAVLATKRTNHLVAGTYVVVLEHSNRGVPASEVRVTARLAP